MQQLFPPAPEELFPPVKVQAHQWVGWVDHPMTKGVLSWVQRQVYELNQSALLGKAETQFLKSQGKAEAYVALLEWIATEQLKIETDGSNFDEKTE